ncbi:MAG: Nitrate transporter substrate-binding protein [Sphingomonadales bacterium]|nr:Nitrate transporter substrate-binding protein [Sphingomonadales bacterium]
MLGWFDEEFERVGGNPTYLRSLADNVGWLPHFNHSHDNLFRDGGAIPPIHAKASGTNTVLVALTWVKAGVGGQIVVRADSDIRTVANLRGRPIGLYRSLNRAKVDFRRATAERQLLLALEIAGVGRNEVNWVDIDDAEAPKYRAAKDPADYIAQGRAFDKARDDERAALASGKVDAIYASGGRTAKLIAGGEFVAIEDLSRYPDWRLHIANSPFATTVNRDFAERHPEVVVAWLRSAARAGRWVNDNTAAAAELFGRVLQGGDGGSLAAQIAQTDFVPSLASADLAALAEQKRFLRAEGYIERDFDVSDWADSRYLRDAISSL